jgi:predicted transcriptional regulator
MIELKLDLPKGLEQHLEYLTILSKRSKEFIIKEALIQYLEDAEDIAKLSEWIEKNKEGKTYTSEELDHLLEQKGLKEANV